MTRRHMSKPSIESNYMIWGEEGCIMDTVDMSACAGMSERERWTLE